MIETFSYLDGKHNYHISNFFIFYIIAKLRKLFIGGLFCTKAQSTNSFVCLWQFCAILWIVEKNVLLARLRIHWLFLADVKDTPLLKECLNYDTKLHLIVRLLFWRHRECEVSLHCYHSLTPSGSTMKVPSMGRVDLFKKLLVFDKPVCKK